MFADVEAETKLFEQPGILDIVYHIEEGEQYRVGRIIVKIDGDERYTRRSVVLNRISMRPGDIFNLREIRNSERRLMASQLFLTDPAQGIAPSITVKPPDPETLARDPRSSRRRSWSIAGSHRPAPHDGRRSDHSNQDTALGGRNGSYRDTAQAISGIVRGLSDPGRPDRGAVGSRDCFCLLLAAGCAQSRWQADRPLTHDPPVQVEPLLPSTRFTPQVVRSQGPTPTDFAAGDTDFQPLSNATDLPRQPMPVSGVSSPTPGLPTEFGRCNTRAQYDADSLATLGTARAGCVVHRERYPSSLECIRTAGQRLCPAVERHRRTLYAACVHGAPASNSRRSPLPPPYPGTTASPMTAPTSPPVSPVWPGTPPAVPGSQVSALHSPNPNLPLGPNSPPPLYGPDARFADVYVNLQEAQTGRLMIGAAVNSEAGVTGQIIVDERNFDWRAVPRSWDDVISGRAFRGAGQTFRLEALPGNQFERYQVNFAGSLFLEYSLEPRSIRLLVYPQLL